MSIFGIDYHQLVQQWMCEKYAEKFWVMPYAAAREKGRISHLVKVLRRRDGHPFAGCHFCHSHLTIHWVTLPMRPFIRELTIAFFIVRSIGSFTILAPPHLYLHIVLIWCEWNEQKLMRKKFQFIVESLITTRFAEHLVWSGWGSAEWHGSIE